jgi:hypothetical protein
MLVTLVVLGCAGAAAGDGPEDVPVAVVSGQAQLSVAPDEARLRFAITTEDRRSQRAAARNAVKAEAVMSALKDAVGADGEVRTLGYSLSPQYQYPQGGKRTLSGYRASNVIEVRSEALGRVGELIDAAIAAGANEVQQLSFGLKDDIAARSEALRRASLRARAKADAVASALGLEVVKVRRIEEGGVEVSPMRDRRVMSMRAEAAPTPVEPGSVDVRASVRLEVELGR